MRRVSLFLLLMAVFQLPLFPFSLELEPDCFVLENGNLSFEVSNGRGSFASPFLEWGEIDRKGLIRTLQNPYSSSSLIPSADMWKKNGNLAGGIISYSGLSFFSLWGERDGLGGAYSSRYLSFALVYLRETPLKEHTIEKDRRYLGRNETLYGALSFDALYVKGLFILSAFPDLLGKIYADFKIKYSILEAEVKLGNTLSVTGREESLSSQYSFRIGDTKAYFEYSLSQGEKPVYAGEYQIKETKIRARVNLDAVTISSETSVRRNKHGAETRKDHLGFDTDYVQFGFKSETGYYYKLRFSHFSFKYENGIFSNEIEVPFSNNSFNLMLCLSSRGTFEVRALINFPS